MIGAGALGNEILKNLALLGVGQVVVADVDMIEMSNLSRSVLFRAGDLGKARAEVAASRAAELYPEIRIQAFVGDVVHDLGLGIYRWADVILAGLDNREARVWVNRAVARSGKIWIDGAIERLDGVARVFDSANGPCYECTMGEADWKELDARRSCALLTRAEMERGKVPTTPTTASVIAGIQAQEAVKALHGLEVLTGRGFVFEGTRHDSYVIRYSRKEDCPSHDVFGPVFELREKVSTTRLGDLLERARADLGDDPVIEINQELLASFHCHRCGRDEAVMAPLGKVKEGRGLCPGCREQRTPRLVHSFSVRDREWHDLTLDRLGVPAWDVIGARSGIHQRYYEFAGDREAILGPMATECEATPAARGPHE